MKMNKIITKDQNKKFLENKFKQMYEQRSHWCDMYFNMKAKKNLYRMSFQGVSLVTIMSLCIFFSLTEAISGRGHTAITLWLAGMGFGMWSYVLLVNLFYGVKK